MKKIRPPKAKSEAYQMLWLQAYAIDLGSLLALVVVGQKFALSVLLGGLIVFLPSLFFAYRLFAATGARAIKRILWNLYVGETLKLLLYGVLFCITIKLFTVNVMAVIFGFLFAEMAFVLSPLVLLMLKRVDR